MDENWPFTSGMDEAWPFTMNETRPATMDGTKSATMDGTKSTTMDGTKSTTMDGTRPALPSLRPLVNRINELAPQIQSILDSTKTPGCSFGVSHNGHDLVRTNVGPRNLDPVLPITSDTVFPLHQLTMAMTAAAFATFVAEGMVEWETPMKRVLPALIDGRVTALDLLCMCSGRSPANPLLCQGRSILYPKENTVALWNALPFDEENRGSFKENSLDYALVALMIEKLAGKTLSQVLHERIFAPLGLLDTKIRDQINADLSQSNVANLYYASDEMKGPMGYTGVVEGGFLEGAFGLVSTINDMMRLYSSYLAALLNQIQGECDKTPGNPFVHCRSMFHTASFLHRCPEDVSLSQAYAFGWIRCTLPGPLGALGLNATRERKPVVLQGGELVLCLYHQGMWPGSVANVALFPQTGTIVAVVANASQLGDAADLISQMIVEEVFEPPNRNNYPQIAATTARRFQNHQNLVGRTLRECHASAIPQQRPLHSLTGYYYNARFIFNIRIEMERPDGGLRVIFRGSETYTLQHVGADFWSWWMPFEQSCHRARYVHIGGAKYFMLGFSQPGRLMLWLTANSDIGPLVFKIIEDPSAVRFDSFGHPVLTKDGEPWRKPRRQPARGSKRGRSK